MGTVRQGAALAVMVIGVLVAPTACSNKQTGTALPAHTDESAVVEPSELCPALRRNAGPAISEILGTDKVDINPAGPGGALCRFTDVHLTGGYPTTGAGTIVPTTTDTVQDFIDKNRRTLAARAHNIAVTPVSGLSGAQVVSGVDSIGIMRGFGAVAVQGGLLEISVFGKKITAEKVGKLLTVVYDNATR